MNRQTHTLILGSYPGKEALQAREYYAGDKNQFWALMSVVLGTALADIPYAKKLEILLENGIGLWDVVSASESRGSLLSVLREKNPERFHYLKEHAPRLRKICFNGQPPGEYAPLFESAGYETLVLPSSSPMYSRQPLDKKLETWQQITGQKR